MVGACSTYGGQEGCIHVSVRKPWGKIPLEDLGVDVRIIFKWIWRKGD